MSAREELFGFVQAGAEEEDLPTFAAAVDAYRTEVIAKAVGRLRAIPVDCTALTGPVWYGDGWNSAITCLEEIADYQTPDDEAYPGELQRLRALALGLRVAALRKEDLAEARRLLVVHAEHEMNAREKATAPAATLTVYRAEWYGDPLCTYTNLRAAQKHCEAAARINLFNRDDVPVSWIPDDEDDPVIWDLVERRGDVKEPTGYCVVGTDVASEYDDGGEPRG